MRPDRAHSLKTSSAPEAGGRLLPFAQAPTFEVEPAEETTGRDAPSLVHIECAACLAGLAVLLIAETVRDTRVGFCMLLACGMTVLAAWRAIKLGLVRLPSLPRNTTATGQDLLVKQRMTTEVVTVPMCMPLRRLIPWMEHPTRAHHQAFPVVDETGRLVSIVTRSDLPQGGMRDELDWLLVADVLNGRPLVVAWPDEPLAAAAQRMARAGVGRLPVVDRQAADRLVGLLTRDAALCGLALSYPPAAA